MDLNKIQLKQLLDQRAELYNRPSFIGVDPISIPHRFSKKEDIEVAGFLAAAIAWGNRVAILRSADRMLSYMGNSPFFFSSRRRHTR